ncbi:MAG: nitroreductase [Chloroflexi bacterium RBG_16_51_16]|nr:MAG: nitroreductase [Chloroflexi bacterium RBG_16_51_16]
MKSNSKVFDSPIGWVRSHINDYVATKGKKGHNWQGLPTLLLTTVGRKSGKLRRTALIYGRDGNDYLVVASNGGAIHHPEWYLNLVKTPAVEVQVGADKFTAQTRTAPVAEKSRLWQLMTNIFAQYDDYQIKASEAGRDIPLVILKHIENKSKAEV